METPLDATLPETALSLIDRYGVTATLKASAGQVYSPSDGRVMEVAGVDVPVKMTPLGKAQSRFVDGVLTQEGDASTFVAGNALAVPPEVGQTVVHSGQTFSIVRVQPLRSGEKVAAYKLLLKG